MSDFGSPRFRCVLTALALLVALGDAAPLRAAGPAGGTSTTTRPATRPPYYHGKLTAGTGVAAHVPVAVAAPLPGMPDEWIPRQAMERLAADLGGWLERAGVTVRLELDPDSPKVLPPSVYFGCSLDMIGECSEDPRQNVLAVTTATRGWRSLLASVAGPAGSDRVLLLEVGLAPHWVHQKNLKGAKEVRLGTDYSQRLPWLTSLDTPVWVLQITGAVVDGEGKVLRSGAEGLWAVRTPFKASVGRAQKLMSEEDVEAVRTGLRREDLPGTPLVWETALRQLLAQLLGPSALSAG